MPRALSLALASLAVVACTPGQPAKQGDAAAAVQVATRFTVTKECGLPDEVKQDYFKAEEDEIEVNQISPTGSSRVPASPYIAGRSLRPHTFSTAWPSICRIAIASVP